MTRRAADEVERMNVLDEIREDHRRSRRRRSYIRVTATQEEIAEFIERNGRRPGVYRGKCPECGLRLWASGLAIGSHRKACRMRYEDEISETEKQSKRNVEARRALPVKADGDSIVVAVTDTGERVRAFLPMGWKDAQDEWVRLDDRRRAGTINGFRFFAVRSLDDPDYASAPKTLYDLVEKGVNA